MLAAASTAQHPSGAYLNICSGGAIAAGRLRPPPWLRARRAGPPPRGHLQRRVHEGGPAKSGATTRKARAYARVWCEVAVNRVPREVTGSPRPRAAQGYSALVASCERLLRDGRGLPHGFVHVALGPLSGVTSNVACTRGVPVRVALSARG